MSKERERCVSAIPGGGGAICRALGSSADLRAADAWIVYNARRGDIPLTMAPVPLQTRSVRVPTAPPTRARHVVTTFAVALAIITYIDRVCISQAAPAMRNDLRLTAVEMGWAFSVFSWAYALFEIPGGWLGDRLGPRRVLMSVVIWWTCFLAALGRVW